MAVYTVEIPNNSPRKFSQKEVEQKIKDAFEYANIKVDLKHRGSLKDLALEEEYNIMMGAG